MKGHRWLLIGAGAFGAIGLFIILTILFIPDRLLQELAARALLQQGYTLRTASFGKSFPLGVKAVDVEIADERGLLLKARKANLRLRLLPLLAGREVLAAQVEIGTGHAEGEYSLRDGAGSVTASGVRLEDLPFIATITGAQLKGALTVSGRAKGKGGATSGDLQVEARNTSITGVKIGGVPLPDAIYPRIQGMMRVGRGVITLSSFTLEGEGLYARLKGDVPVVAPLGQAPLNLNLELMPKPDFLEKQKFVFLLLAKYLKAPGDYEIPIRGTLSNPAVR